MVAALACGDAESVRRLAVQNEPLLAHLPLDFVSGFIESDASIMALDLYFADYKCDKFLQINKAHGLMTAFSLRRQLGLDDTVRPCPGTVIARYYPKPDDCDVPHQIISFSFPDKRPVPNDTQVPTGQE